MKTFVENTPDKGWKKIAYARDNMAKYILTSARMHDLYTQYINRYDRIPTAKWYHRHAQFILKR